MRCAVMYLMLLGWLTLASVGQIGGAYATSIEVLAVVNGTPITNLDLEERRNFLIKTTGIEITPSNRQQIDRDVMQMLVDDALKQEESLRLGGALGVDTRNRAKQLVDASFSQHGEDPDIVMERLGIRRDFAEDKFLVDVLWASTVQSRFFDEFANIPVEATKELERIATNIRKPQVNLDEIALLPEPNRNRAETLQVAREMVAAIRQGADFGRIAQQFSASGTSRNGGNVGWVLLERLPQSVRSTIENLAAGTVAEPIEIDGAIVIYRVNGIRLDGNTDPLENRITVGRLAMPVAETDSISRTIALEQVRRDIAGVESCADLKTIHDGYNTGIDFDFGTFILADLPTQLRTVLLPLEVGGMSDAFDISEGIVVFMVCDKAVPTLELPQVEAIESRIRNRHFAVLAERYLGQLRRRATIDYRQGS